VDVIQNNGNKLFALIDWLLKKVPEIPLVKKLTICLLKVKLESLRKLTFYPSVFLLMIKMSHSAREKFDSYCKNTFLSNAKTPYFVIYNTDCVCYKNELNLNKLISFPGFVSPHFMLAFGS